MQTINFRRCTQGEGHFRNLCRLFNVFGDRGATCASRVSRLCVFLYRLQQVKVAISRTLCTVLVYLFRSLRNVFYYVPKVGSRQGVYLLDRYGLPCGPVPLLHLCLQFLVPMVVRSSLSRHGYLLRHYLLFRPYVDILVWVVRIAKVCTRHDVGGEMFLHRQGYYLYHHGKEPCVGRQQGTTLQWFHGRRLPIHVGFYVVMVYVYLGGRGGYLSV